MTRIVPLGSEWIAGHAPPPIDGEGDALPTWAQRSRTTVRACKSEGGTPHDKGLVLRRTRNNVRGFENLFFFLNAGLEAHGATPLNDWMEAESRSSFLMVGVMGGR